MLEPEKNELDAYQAECESWVETGDEMTARLAQEDQHHDPSYRMSDLDPYIEEYNEHLRTDTLQTFEQYKADYLASLQEEYEARDNYERKIAPILLAKTLFDRPRMPVQAYCQDFIYAGGLTAVCAEPKAGKSTLVWYLLNAISKGDTIFGRRCSKGNVLYVSEQNEACFRDQASRVPRITDNEDLGILLAESNKVPNPSGDGEFIHISTWDAQLSFWEQRIKDFDADVFVIDTLGAYFHLPPGGENDNGVMQQRMAQLRQFFNIRKHLAIVLIHHNRKEITNGNGRNADRSLYPSLNSIRGASAIAGAADHAICLGAPKEPLDTNRYISFFGRYVESNGMRMQVSRDTKTEEYAVVSTERPYGSKEVYVSQQERLRKLNEKKLLAVLPRTLENAQSVSELKHSTGLHNRTLKPLLSSLNCETIGRGVKGNPVLYWLDEGMPRKAKKAPRA